ncbi:DUF6335 family protein [Almyronema epifaneia]|uniref:DUF6335 family protein n=1 Tax=Almyronema epifaneia S1 TaxID=2991925 RepID=A0ABW6IG80_9CYAN
MADQQSQDLQQGYKIAGNPEQPNQPAKIQAEADSMAEAVRMGLEDHSDRAGATVADNREYSAAGASTVGGDPDAMADQAKVVGEEAVGGTTPTPDQNVVDDIGEAMGIEAVDEQPLEITERMHARDRERAELDPLARDDNPPT